MNIKRAKQEIKNALRAYLAKDEFGAWRIPPIRQRPVLLIGPPGVGKTQIMEQIARECKVGLVSYTITHHTRQSAVGLPFIKEKTFGQETFSVTEYTMSEIIASVYEKMEKTGLREGILFIDEIHRFNRAQQDALLHAVEDGIVVLIGATTENPFFEVNSALISRSRIVELHRLDEKALSRIIDHALKSDEGLKNEFTLDNSARKSLLLLAGGDARNILNTLALSADLCRAQGTSEINEEIVHKAVPQRALPYDKKQDMHYDIISAFIKSMRGSDPDAALYWLARMIDGGEDPKFIARRIFIFAAEDIGNADPQAVLIGEAAFRAAEVIGYPECRINLAQACVYMALAPKSNASYSGLAKAMEEVKKGPLRAVPDHLRDRHRPGSDEYGDYLYPHEYPSGYVSQRYLPDGLEPGIFFTAGERGWERYRIDSTLRDRMDR